MEDVKPTSQPESQPQRDSLGMLDTLIKESFNGLTGQISGKVKIGEFLKMIELHRKLEPADPSQKKFWKMMEQIRQDELEDEKNESTTEQETEINEENA
jgi:hypothetical protein